MKQKQKEFSERFLGIIGRLGELEKIGQKDANEKLDIIPFPSEDVMTVTVLGYTKCGKSSLVNMLVLALQSIFGDKYSNSELCFYCPVENRAFTNLLWKLSYGEKNEYILERRDGSFENVPLENDLEDQLYDFVHSLRESPIKMRNFLIDYKPKIEVKLNLESLRLFEICDVPGKGESSELNQLIFEQVKKSDILIYVFESNRGKLSQLDQNFIRELKKYTSSDSSALPLENRIIFVGNKVDLNLPSRSARHRKISLKKSNIQALVDSIKETILYKLNNSTLFDGMIEPHQVFLTCSNEQVRVFQHFQSEILKLRDSLLKRRDELHFRIPALVNCTNILNSISQSLSLLEGMENKIRCLNDIFRSGMKVRKQVDICAKTSIEKLKQDLTEFLHNKYEFIRDIVCEEDIDPESVHFNLDSDRIKYAKSFLKNKFDTVVTNEIRKIYTKNVNEFQNLVIRKLSELSPLANELFSSDLIFDEIEEKKENHQFPQMTNKVLYPPKNSPTLKNIILFTVACNAVVLAAPPLIAMSIVLSPLYILTLPFSTIVPVEVTIDTIDDLSTRTEFDLIWRRQSFDEIYKKFHSKSGEKKILKLLSTHILDSSHEYFENLQKSVLSRVEDLEKKRGLGRIDVKKLSNKFYVLEVDTLTLKHDYLFVKNGTVSGPVSKGERLGKGSFAKVYATSMFENSTPVACKIQRYGTNIGKQEICREISVLRRHCSHRGLVKFLSCSHEGNERRISIFMERCPYNLSSIINDHTIGLSERIDIGRQIANIMGFLNKKGIFHRDLKPENILTNIDKDEVFLCDFGSAKSIGMSLCTHESVGGSNFYLDPVIQCRLEFRLRLNYGLKRDIYSMGILLAELWQSERVWKGLLSKSYSDFVETPCLVDHGRNKELFMNLKMLNKMSKEYPEEDPDLEVQNIYQKLVDRCTCLVEDMRPSFKEVEEILKDLFSRIGKLEESKEVFESNNNNNNNIREEVIQL